MRALSVSSAAFRPCMGPEKYARFSVCGSHRNPYPPARLSPALSVIASEAKRSSGAARQTGEGSATRSAQSLEEASAAEPLGWLRCARHEGVWLGAFYFTRLILAFAVLPC